MSVQIQCNNCQGKYWVDGYCTPDSWTDPGETIIPESETFLDCCPCIQAGGAFDVIGQDDEFDDPMWYDDE